MVEDQRGLQAPIGQRNYISFQDGPSLSRSAHTVAFMLLTQPTVAAGRTAIIHPQVDGAPS